MGLLFLEEGVEECEPVDVAQGGGCGVLAGLTLGLAGFALLLFGFFDLLLFFADLLGGHAADAIDFASGGDEA